MEAMCIGPCFGNIQFIFKTCNVGKIVLASQLNIDKKFVVFQLHCVNEIIIVPNLIIKLPRNVIFNIINVIKWIIFPFFCSNS